MKEKKYFELYCSVKEQIESGEYKNGEKLPSKRVMADKSGVSVITVAKAYEMLAEEGYIRSAEKSGYFVCGSAGFEKAEPKKQPFAYLPESVEVPETEFEYSVWFKTVRKVLSEQDSRLFVKSPNKGIPALRNALSDYLYRYRGMRAEPSSIIIGSGAEQLYETVVKILGRDLVYGIENPSYPQIEAVYRGAEVEIQKLKMGADGIETKALESGKMDVLHVTPFKSYPTNVTTSVQKRHAYLKWAEVNKRYIVEDDFNSEFFMPGQPVRSLFALDKKDKVIYINTFSKSLSPAMRMGYMILPEALMEKYDKILSNFSCSVPVLDQYVLAEFIKSGNFERHLNRMRRKLNLR